MPETTEQEIRKLVPDDSDTAHSIDRNDAYGEIAAHLRSDFRHKIIPETAILSMLCDDLERQEREWEKNEER